MRMTGSIRLRVGKVRDAEHRFAAAGGTGRDLARAATAAASSTPEVAEESKLPESLRAAPPPNILATHRGGLISNTVLGASDGATSLLLSSMRRSIAVFLDPNPAITARRLAASEE